MRELVIAALAAIVTTLCGCVEPQPQAPVEVPTSEPPPAAVEQPTPATTTASPIAAPTSEPPPASPEQPTPAATTASPVAAPTSEAPPPAVRQPAPATPTTSPVVADTDNRPTPAPRAPPRDDVAPAQTSPPPPTRSSANATASSPEESTTPPTPPVATPTPAEPPTPPELDLAELEQRLRETRAIGVFTKLSLKNQVDDLLDQFRGFYRGQLKVPLAELRQRYELLLLKVLTLLQDSDRELAAAITASREAIWGILSDPQKLANI